MTVNKKQTNKTNRNILSDLYLNILKKPLPIYDCS